MASPKTEGQENLQRVMRIAHEHILYAERYPDRLRLIASQLKVTTEAALALAIADQVNEEFTLILKD